MRTKGLRANLLSRPGADGACSLREARDHDPRPEDGLLKDAFPRRYCLVITHQCICTCIMCMFDMSDSALCSEHRCLQCERENNRALQENRPSPATLSDKKWGFALGCGP